MIYLRPDDRAKCAAVRHVVRNTALANCTAEAVVDGVPQVHLTQPPHTLSAGEFTLWEFCRSIDGSAHVSLFVARRDTDDHSRRVMAEALALWFGLPVEAAA